MSDLQWSIMVTTANIYAVFFFSYVLAVPDDLL